jgi:hypothetical protein
MCDRPQTLVCNKTNHVVLISSLSTKNQYQYVTKKVRSAVAYWSRRNWVAGSNARQI